MIQRCEQAPSGSGQRFDVDGAEDRGPLGRVKYRQLRMHLSGALRLLGELSITDPNSSASAPATAETAEAVAALTERLRTLSPRREPLSIREPTPAKRLPKRRARRL
jgi:hypothetical protein